MMPMLLVAVAMAEPGDGVGVAVLQPDQTLVLDTPLAPRAGACRVSPDWSTVALLGSGEVLLWSLAEDAVTRLPYDGRAAGVPAWSHDGAALAWREADAVVVADARTGAPRGRLPTPEGDRLTALAASPSEDLLALGFESGRVWLWDWVTDAVTTRWAPTASAASGATEHLQFALHAPRLVATHAEDGLLVLSFDAEGKQTADWSWSAPEDFTGTVDASLSADGQRVLVQLGVRATLLDVDSGEALGSTLENRHHRLLATDRLAHALHTSAPSLPPRLEGATAVQVRQDGALVLLVGRSGGLYVADASGTVLRSMGAGPRRVESAAFHPSEPWLLIHTDSVQAVVSLDDRSPPRFDDRVEEGWLDTPIGGSPVFRTGDAVHRLSPDGVLERSFSDADWVVPVGPDLLARTDTFRVVWSRLDTGEEVALERDFSKPRAAAVAGDALFVADGQRLESFNQAGERTWLADRLDDTTAWLRASPDGRWVVRGTAAGVSVFDGQTGDLVRVLEQTGLAARDLTATFDPQGDLVVLQRGVVWRWRLPDGPAQMSAAPPGVDQMGPTGEWVLYTGGRVNAVLDPTTGRRLFSWEDADGRARTGWRLSPAADRAWRVRDVELEVVDLPDATLTATMQLYDDDGWLLQRGDHLMWSWQVRPQLVSESGTEALPRRLPDLPPMGAATGWVPQIGELLHLEDGPRPPMSETPRATADRPAWMTPAHPVEWGIFGALALLCVGGGLVVGRW